MQLLLSDSTLNFIRQCIKLLPFSWLLTQSVFWITFADLFKICIYSCEKTETYTQLSCILYLITVRFCKHTGCFLQRRIRFYTKQLRNGWLSKNYVGSSNGIRISTYTAWKKNYALYYLHVCLRGILLKFFYHPLLWFYTSLWVNYFALIVQIQYFN